MNLNSQKKNDFSQRKIKIVIKPVDFLKLCVEKLFEHDYALKIKDFFDRVFKLRKVQKVKKN
jgi:hypothetical protein